jgi:hypothetical protein
MLDPQSGNVHDPARYLNETRAERRRCLAVHRRMPGSAGLPVSVVSATARAGDGLSVPITQGFGGRGDPLLAKHSHDVQGCLWPGPEHSIGLPEYSNVQARRCRLWVSSDTTA